MIIAKNKFSGTYFTGFGRGGCGWDSMQEKNAIRFESPPKLSSIMIDSLHCGHLIEFIKVKPA